MTVVLSWNINGFRSILKKGFIEWLEKVSPDIICLQETKLKPSDINDNTFPIPSHYHTYWSCAKKPGYSGTAFFSKNKPIQIIEIDDPDFTNEGRLQIAEFSNFILFNSYWPNSQEEKKRLPYKLEFIDKLQKTLLNFVKKKRKNILVCGDFNIAHTEIDLARPKENENHAGYYPEEREAMTKFLNAGFVDTFRMFCKEGGHYTWWSYRTNARARNIGWRIDYHVVNEAFKKQIKRSWILSDVLGSDHCPIGVEII
ncbi:MAG TPA: exodeoxyribonuclease III [Candidatus Hydrogenedens sp.]|nr:exodeoxyribonuclease III [Candidatus Hydrogenedens sp.]HPP59793.1 exodeoxyribonuclease III [Candidatus Hydrogenedens sp.]